MLFQKNILRKYLATLPAEQIAEAWSTFQSYFLNADIQQNILQSKEEQFQEGFLRELFVKVGNASADKKVAKVDLSRFKGMKKVAERTVLSGNPEDGNTFGKITVEPVRDVVNVKPRMTLDIEPYSFVMLKIKL